MPYLTLEQIPEPKDGAKGKKLSILLLADDRHEANVVQDHISSIVLESRHNYKVVNPIYTDLSCRFLACTFDVILIHYSLFVLEKYYLSFKWRMYVEKFIGFKAQIIQDECRRIDAMQSSIASLGINVVFSSLAKGVVEKVYAEPLLDDVDFISCLPGYIPEQLLNRSLPQIKDRPYVIIYRGRTLPPQYGRHGQDKYLIAKQMLEVSRKYGLHVDITADEESRIYGADWLSFMMSGRATLGVEGGSSIFDFDGHFEKCITAYLESKPDAEFDQIYEDMLVEHDGILVHKTITPKIFEAIASKTALVLYPGEYRGVLTMNKHYIPLLRDGSNVDDVVEKLLDVELLQKMVDDTYKEIVGDETLHFAYYRNKIDDLFSVKANFSLAKRLLMAGTNVILFIYFLWIEAPGYCDRLALSAKAKLGWTGTG
jgi:hypothetical protein